MRALYQWKTYGFVLLLILASALCLDVERIEAAEADTGTVEEAAPEIWGDENYPARYQETEGGDWIYADFLTACRQVYSGGTVQLGQDAYANGILTVASGRNITVASFDPEHPCAYSVQLDRHPWLILVNPGGRLCLQDVIIDGGSGQGLIAGCPLVAVNGGELLLKSGAVICNNDNRNPVKIDGSTPGGGGVVLLGNGTVTMEEGASIRNCQAYYGGGVAVIGSGDQRFTMNGGAIEGCTSARGGGVYINHGMFVMNGGEIRGNTAQKRDGVEEVTEFNGQGGGMIIAGDGAHVEIQSGSVIQNSSEEVAGGIRCERGTCRIVGGSVTENHAGTHAGGILTNPLFTSLRLSVGAYIDENTEEENEPGRNTNLYLDGNETDSGDGSDNTPPFEFESVEIREGMAPIRISRWVNPDADNPVRVVGYAAAGHVLTEEMLPLFRSDNEEYAVILTPGQEEYENQMVLAITSLEVTLEQEELLLELPGNNAGRSVGYGMRAVGETEEEAERSHPLTVQIVHLPQGAIHKGLIWTSSDESVAVVDDQGNVTAVGEGQAVITVTLRGNENIPAYTDECVVAVSAGTVDIPQEDPPKSDPSDIPGDDQEIPDKPITPNDPDSLTDGTGAAGRPSVVEGEEGEVPDNNQEVPDHTQEAPEKNPETPEEESGTSVPSGLSPVNDSPKTGDATDIWTTMVLWAGTGLLCLFLTGRKLRASGKFR